MSIVVPNFDQIGRFLYFGGHFRFKMAAITWHKNRSSLKVVLSVFKIFKMAANIKIKKSLKIQKWKDFNGNGYLQAVRHAAPYGDHFGLLWQPGSHRLNRSINPLDVNHFLWNLFIFKFLYWRTFWKFKKLSAQLWVMIYFCVKFQKDPLYTFRDWFAMAAGKP
jgi:hypothetical protein